MTRGKGPRGDRTKKGGDFCTAAGCGNARNKKSSVGRSFFTYPKDEERCKIWIQMSQRKFQGHDIAVFNKRGYKFCSDHFEDSQFCTSREQTDRPRLVWNAIPTLFTAPNTPAEVPVTNMQPVIERTRSWEPLLSNYPDLLLVQKQSVFDQTTAARGSVEAMPVETAVVEEQTDSAVGTSNSDARVSPEVQIPNGFVPEAPKDFRVLQDCEPDTELWLVRVPQEFDPFVLHHKLKASVLAASSSQTIKAKDAEAQKQYYAVHSYRDLNKSQRMSLVVAGDDNSISLGQDVKNMLVVTKTIKTPKSSHHNKMPTPKKPVPLPEGLKVRFTTFGTEAPISSQQERKKSKKRKREQDLFKASDDVILPAAVADRSPALYASDLPSPHKKSRKPHSREWNASLQTSDELEQSFSPSKKKHKKNKHHHLDPEVDSFLNSESCNFTDGSGCLVEVPESDTPKKEKKKKKHKHRESDSVIDGMEEGVGQNHQDSVNSALFMVDRAGGHVFNLDRVRDHGLNLDRVGNHGLNLDSSTVSEKGMRKHK